MKNTSKSRVGLLPSIKILFKEWPGLRSAYEAQKDNIEKLKAKVERRSHNEQMARSGLLEDTDKATATTLERRILRKTAMIEDL